jgi:crossover junction endodeoxyribonuclease RusA
VNITLPWPDRDLWTNAKKRAHWRVVSARTAEARRYAQVTTKQALSVVPKQPIGCELWIKFAAPTRRRYDVANALEACKPYIDGVCDALGVDDSVFTRVCCVRLPGGMPGPGVVIEIGAV